MELDLKVMLVKQPHICQPYNTNISAEVESLRKIYLSDFGYADSRNIFGLYTIYIRCKLSGGDFLIEKSIHISLDGLPIFFTKILH
jgi:hypothetical protein